MPLAVIFWYPARFPRKNWYIFPEFGGTRENFDETFWERMEFVNDKQEGEAKSRGTCRPYGSIVLKSHSRVKETKDLQKTNSLTVNNNSSSHGCWQKCSQKYAFPFAKKRLETDFTCVSNKRLQFCWVCKSTDTVNWNLHVIRLKCIHSNQDLDLLLRFWKLQRARKFPLWVT